MRRLLALTASLAVLGTACPSEDVVSETPASEAVASPTSELTPAAPLLAEAETCMQLLPALDGNLEGLDRFATEEVLAFLASHGVSSADVVGHGSDYDGQCHLDFEDHALSFRLRVGNIADGRAIDVTDSRKSFEDAVPPADREAVAAAVTQRRTTDEHCGGADEAPDDPAHLVTDGRNGSLVAIRCAEVRGQASWEVLGWNAVDATLVDLAMEQWRDGAFVASSLVVGDLVAQDGVLASADFADTSEECGVWQQWFEGGGFALELSLVRARSCGSDAPYNLPEFWPVVYAAAG